MELLKACENRELHAIETLLQRHFIDLTATDSKGRSVLHLALGTSKVNIDKPKMHRILVIVRLLCEHGADVNAADHSGLCPIHYCAKTMNTEAAKYLLEHKVRINEPDSQGRTALYFTATDGHPDPEFAAVLLRKGGKLGKMKPKELLKSANDSQRMVRFAIKRINAA